MPKGKPISPEIKRRAVKALAVPGATVSSVAHELKTSTGNVRRWADAKKGKKAKTGRKAKKSRNGSGRPPGKPMGVVAQLQAEEKSLAKRLGAVRKAIRVLTH